MKDKTFKWIVVVAACVLALGSIGTAIANVKGLFEKKNYDTKNDTDSTKTAYVQYVEDIDL